uniref:Uncharacterized protein n=1 Tax=Myoviridae sp. ctlRg1 TaxID=2826692 RepID=A0A8S5M6I3_9CAUD|nr:MAG TPA: hypothetical protein [Myoviridae sp. ctlRg1]
MILQKKKNTFNESKNAQFSYWRVFLKVRTIAS